MRLFLIRHGETVDNVAGLYAGSRDSALTNHGVQQARRLGAWISESRSPLTHIFASPLQRAYKTAEAISLAQNDLSNATPRASIVKVEELVEQDFGFYEGKPFYARQRDMPNKSGREARYEGHKDDPGFVDVESKGSLAKRSDAFLDVHLLPLLRSDESGAERVVVIVSHGILLSHLWRRLLLRLPPRSVKVAPEVSTAKGQIVLEHLGGWSNTGFLELLVEPTANPEALTTSRGSGDEKLRINHDTATAPASLKSTAQTLSLENGDLSEDTTVQDDTEFIQKLPSSRLDGLVTTIIAIDGKQHLQGLKRTRGGIGRAQYDDKQKTMDSFFKRAKKG